MEMDSKFSAAVPGPLEYMGWLEFVLTNLYLKKIERKVGTVMVVFPVDCE
jgi:hypothetical protein